MRTDRPCMCPYCYSVIGLLREMEREKFDRLREYKRSKQKEKLKMMYHKYWTKGAGNTLRKYEGWFLFGIIPLFITRTYDAKYKR